MQSLLRQSYGLSLVVLLISGIELFAWFYLWRQGLVGLLLDSDRSFVSGIIIVIYALATAYFIWISYQVSRQFDFLSGTAARRRVTPLLQRFFDELPLYIMNVYF